MCWTVSLPTPPSGHPDVSYAVGMGGGAVLPRAWSFQAQLDGELWLPHRDLDMMFVGMKLVCSVILSNDSGLGAPLKLIRRNMV